MKKRGFTLIELLAVIVILAIIALIATPIIMNVIEKSRKGAAERSVENYINAVETTVATERINGEFLEGEYTIQSDGSLCEGSNVTNCEKPIKIDMSGNKPSSGSIFIDNGIVTTDSNMTMGDYAISYDSEKKTYVASEIGSTGTTLCTYQGTDASKKYEYGAEYECELGDGETRTFYVLENGDTTELTTGRMAQEGEISLIMDRDLGEVTAWNTTGKREDGPTAATAALADRTSNWSGLHEVNGIVSLPSAYQLAQVVGGNINPLSSFQNLPDWLTNYVNSGDSSFKHYYTSSVLSFTSGSPIGVEWTEVSTTSGTNYLIVVNGSGYVGTNGLPWTTAKYYGGIRPVITIPKTQLG